MPDPLNHDPSRSEVALSGTCPSCRYCRGNGVVEDGYACADCEGTGCQRYPFCGIDHDAEEADRA